MGLIKIKKAAALIAAVSVLLSVWGAKSLDVYADDEPEVTIRVCNWEEYIDLGDWDDDEVIDLESGDIIGVNTMIEDFEQWYEETYGIKVNVEYSTFGTNEILYSMLNIGDVYDLVCPSEYMVMKLMHEGKLEPLSDEFYDTEDENNYYINGVSPYIENILETHDIDGEAWSDYMAGYMWGVTGVLYNADDVSREETSTWNIFNNKDYACQVSIKDNVRDSYFAAVGALKSDLLTSDEFINDPDYAQNLEDEMNDVSAETIQEVQDWLQDVKDNAYSFETDSGKADMISGKICVDYQWSGDATYAMDQTEDEDVDLRFTVPYESSDIYFDGWVMLKNGINGDAAKKHACEAFINFLSRPDNAIRNMYYIGYTSCISGGDDDRMYEYLLWNYEAEDDEEDTSEYDVGWFFTGDLDYDGDDYTFTAPSIQLEKQLYAQYPDKETIGRTCIMTYFDEDTTTQVNQMWINIRCFNIYDVPVWAWIIAAAAAVCLVWFLVRSKRR